MAAQLQFLHEVVCVSVCARVRTCVQIFSFMRTLVIGSGPTLMASPYL